MKGNRETRGHRGSKGKQELLVHKETRGHKVNPEKRGNKESKVWWELRVLRGLQVPREIRGLRGIKRLKVILAHTGASWASPTPTPSTQCAPYEWDIGGLGGLEWGFRSKLEYIGITANRLSSSQLYELLRLKDPAWIKLLVGVMTRYGLRLSMKPKGCPLTSLC